MFDKTSVYREKEREISNYNYNNDSFESLLVNFEGINMNLFEYQKKNIKWMQFVESQVKQNKLSVKYHHYDNLKDMFIYNNNCYKILHLNDKKYVLTSNLNYDKDNKLTSINKIINTIVINKNLSYRIYDFDDYYKRIEKKYRYKEEF